MSKEGKNLYEDLEKDYLASVVAASLVEAWATTRPDNTKNRWEITNTILLEQFTFFKIRVKKQLDGGA